MQPVKQPAENAGVNGDDHNPLLNPLGLTVVGKVRTKRQTVDWRAEFLAHCTLETEARSETESYLSHFWFPATPFSEHFEPKHSEAGYAGPCGADWIFWDIDKADDLAAALQDARRLVGQILDTHRDLDEDQLLIFLSGAKGFHIGMPMTWIPEPSPSFHQTARVFCQTLADSAGVTIDTSIYSCTRLFRAPNSKHPKTGLYKRRFIYRDFMNLKLEALRDLAKEPMAFDPPVGPVGFESASVAWKKAQESSAKCSINAQQYVGRAQLLLSTKKFIYEGELDLNKRELSTFQAVANLAEVYFAYGVEGMLYALLEWPAGKVGLPDSEIRHAVRTGVNKSRRECEATADDQPQSKAQYSLPDYKPMSFKEEWQLKRDKINSQFIDEGQRYLAATDAAVWHTLARDTKYNGEAATAQTDIARRTGLGEKTVRRSLKKLQSMGFVTRISKGTMSTGPSVYKVSPVPSTSGLAIKPNVQL
jgi:hypothetical protein